MKIDARQSCYMCDEPMTSREHVPPKCLFPEYKDSPDGTDYRKGLIMVPSCDNHNGVKSKDDEFFLMYMAANAFSNGTAYIHQATKLERILKRTPHIWAMLMETATPAFVKGPNGQKKETCAFHIDWARFSSQFEHIARGLYYHHFQVKSPADVTIIPVAGLLPANSEAHSFVRNTGEISSALFDSIERFGANPVVFYYQVAQGKAGTLILTTFFEKIKVLLLLG